jgi:hypothetical protein
MIVGKDLELVWRRHLEAGVTAARLVPASIHSKIAAASSTTTHRIVLVHDATRAARPAALGHQDRAHLRDLRMDRAFYNPSGAAPPSAICRPPSSKPFTPPPSPRHDQPTGRVRETAWLR